ncbi:MAG: hypothetical protein ACREKH_19535, partial [Candidatus Rokuibacteriota bacterium]
MSERGGGLLMLGGRRAFAEGGWAGTPVADVLPVELDASYSKDTTFFAEVNVEPTRAGVAHAMMQIAETEDASAARWKTLPNLSTFNRVGRLKPGATALLTGAGSGLPGSQQPVLAHQRYGRGEALALVVQDSWIWQMHAEVPLEDMTHETLWRQLLRWLVSGVPGQVTVALPTDRVAPGEAVRLTAEVNDEGYLKVNNSRVVARLTSPTGTESELPMEWTVDRDGEYRGGFTAAEPGLYEITVEATNGAKTFKETTFLASEESRAEYFGAQMRAPLLERIADETGGRFYTPEDIASLPEDLTITGKGTTVVEEKELWDMPINLLLIVLLMGAE